MKTILCILVVFLLSCSTTLAQRLTLPQYTVEHFNGAQYTVNITHCNFGTDSNYVTGTSNQTVNINFADSSIFQNTMNNFLLGYHWGGGTNKLMERRWHINMPMMDYGFGNGQWLDSIYINQEFDSLCLLAESAKPGHKQYVVWRYYPIERNLYEVNALTWHPSANYTPTDAIFHPITGDTVGAVYGFAIQKGGMYNRTPGSANFMRYTLTPDSVTNGSILCLQKPMLHTQVNKNNGTVSAINDLTSTDAIESRRNGTKWYLSVNLRRLNNNDTLTDVVKVIGVKIKYWKRYEADSSFIDDSGKAKSVKVIRVDSNYIRFDSTLHAQNVLDTMRHARGITHRHLSVPTGTDTNTFFIRRKDIPLYGSNESDRDICLSAYFRTTSQLHLNDNSDPKYAPNPHFATYGVGGAAIGEIDSIDIQVTYYGNCPVSISHITLQTPQAREFLWGYHDSTIAVGVDRLVKTFKRVQAKYPTKTLRFFRFYAIDEANVMQYQAQRYLNALFDKRLTTEMANDYYKYLVPQRDYWTGSSYITTSFQYSSIVPKEAPDDTNYTLHYKGWWANQSGTNVKNWDCKECTHWIAGITYPDSSFGFPGNTTAKLPTDKIEWNNYYDLCALEGTAKSYYLNPKVLYDTLPFIARHTTTVWYDYGIRLREGSAHEYRPYIAMPLGAPLTGEQLRRAVWNSILMGAKGITYADGIRSDTMGNMSVRLQQSITADKPFYPGRANFGLLYSKFNEGVLFNHKVTGDTVGTTTVLSPTYGHDYFTPTPFSNTSTWAINQHNATNLGVDSNKIYIGLRSLRREKMLLNDKIIDLENDLMSLQLMAWEGKGFNFMRSCRDNDTTLYTRFVNMNWNGVKIKDLSDNHVEQWDGSATYFDLALHKYKTLSIDSQFVVMVLNRRINNLVEVNPTGIPDTARYRFYPTIEFDSLVQSNPSLQYSQLGSREITIQFNYRHPDTKTRLLHIQELGGSLDTVICQSCSLSAKYLPGEGKIYRVTVVKPLDRFADRGSLDFVNQHKLIAMPNLIGVNALTRQPIYDSSHIRYHLVFHRLDTVFAVGQPPKAVYQVYYKRSKLIERCAPYDVTNPILTGLNVVWDTTIVLSDTIYKRSILPGIGFDTVNHFTCKYPSLVVRFDTTDLREYVYCVFACQKDNISPILIMESQFSTMPKKGHEIAKADSSDIDTYGHPVINASYLYNYYAYSSYLDGIYVGSRPTDSSNWSVAWNTVSAYLPRSLNSTTSVADARHPSLNPYSNLNNEDECALVWQEKNAVDSNSVWGGWHIYYTRLHRVTQGWQIETVHDLPSMKFDKNGYNIDTLDGTMARVSVFPLAVFGFRNFQMPSVIRMSFPSSNPYIQHTDKVIFQGDTAEPCVGWTTKRTGIFVGHIFSMPNTPTSPDSLASKYGGTIYSCVTTLNNPSGTEGQSYIEGGSALTGGDSSFVLNFDMPDYNWLAHITMSYQAWGSSIQYIENAERAQLAQQPHTFLDYHWTFVRRAQTLPSTAINKSILSSGSELLKRSLSHGLPHYRLSGFQQGTSRFALADILSSQDESTFRQDKKGKNERVLLKDSTASDWFSVYQSKLIQFVLADNDYDVINLNIENRRTGGRVPVNVRSLSPSDGRKIRAGRMVLRNGGGDEYRLILGKASDNAQYYEDVYIGDIPELLGKATTEDDYTLDVSSTLQTKDTEYLFVYPNPVVKEVVIRFEGLSEDITTPDFEYTLECTDALGKVLHKQLIKAKDSVTLQVENLADGVYYIRVRGSVSSISNSFTILK